MTAMPREKIELDIQQVEDLAAQGLTFEQIATCLGISDKTIYRRKGESSEVSEAIKRGRERGVAFAASQLQNMIAQGNLGAVIFYLKTKGGWTEKQIIETKDTTDEKEVAKTLTTAELLELAKAKR